MASHSGPNQHFLPRFLMRGFASRKKGENPPANYFPRGGKARVDTLNNIGAADYFYGHPSESPVDEQFKDQENVFGRIVADFRSVQKTQEVSPEMLPELVVHLGSRSKNIRDSIGVTATQLVKELAVFMASPKGIEIVSKRIENDVRVKMEEFFSSTDFQSLAQTLSIEQLQALKTNVMSQKFDVSPYAEQSAHFLRDALQSPAFHISTANSHIKSLQDSNGVHTPRIAALKPLRWFLHVFESTSLILGDVAVVAQSDVDSPYESMFRNKPPWIVYLPISDSVLLCGATQELSPLINPDLLNHASAELSTDFFISSHHSLKEDRYHTVLGRRTYLLKEKEIIAIVQKMHSESYPLP